MRSALTNASATNPGRNAMKSLETLIGYIASIGGALMVVLAAVVLGTLVVRGPAEDVNYKPPAVSEAAAQPAQAAAAPAAEIAASQPKPDKPQAAATDSGQAQASTTPDPVAGEKVAAKCKSCHGFDKGGANKVGPNLWGVFGANAAAHEGFKYSSAMASQSGQTWDAAALDRFITDPKAAVPGTKMAFAGVKSANDRANLIAFLAQQNDKPVAPESLGLSGSSETQQPAAEKSAAPPETALAPEQAAAAIEPPASLPPPQDPPAPSAARLAEIDTAVAALKEQLPSLDYQRARYHPLHFSPQIEKASNAECLTCHQEIIDRKPLPKSPAGVDAISVLAWYQTLDTYKGDQQTFHWRHIDSPYAKQVMNLQCNFCHKGNDPREESPDMVPNKTAFNADPSKPAFTNRKMVNPSETCLLCHGAMPDPVNIMGLGGPWPEVRAELEDESTPNGCLTCHAESFRTNRHRVTYLNAASIEEAAKTSSDVCYGCHGGRQWYRISYPYPRHPWPGMDPAMPEWAAGRPQESNPHYQMPQTAQ